MRVSTASNLPDIETRTRTVHLVEHPHATYLVTLVKPTARAADAWMLAQVTVRSTGGGPITDRDLFVTAEQLLDAALEDPDFVGPVSPSAAMVELAWLPPRYQRALYRRGIKTNTALFALPEPFLRTVRGIGDHAIDLIEAARTRYEQLPPP